MNIEFHAPHGEVKEWVINYLKEQLMELHRKDKQVSRAQVYFRDQPGGPEPKVCEIDLSIYGDSLFVHRNAGSYEQAAREVLAELNRKVDEQIRRQSEPPEEITSTVKV